MTAKAPTLRKSGDWIHCCLPFLYIKNKKWSLPYPYAIFFIFLFFVIILPVFFTPEMTQQSDIDITLWKRIQENDSSAFESLYKKYYAPLCLYASKYKYDMESAHEIVQNLFVYLWENRATVQIERSVKAYLQSAIQRNCLRDRQKRLIEVPIDELPKDSYDVGELYDALELEDLYRQLLAAIEQLPDQCKKIFKMNRFDDMKYAEIARELQLSIKTVEAQMGKALKTLREKFKHHLPVLWLFIHNPFILSQKMCPVSNQEHTSDRSYHKKNNK